MPSKTRRTKKSPHKALTDNEQVAVTETTGNGDVVMTEKRKEKRKKKRRSSSGRSAAAQAQGGKEVPVVSTEDGDWKSLDASTIGIAGGTWNLGDGLVKKSSRNSTTTQATPAAAATATEISTKTGGGPGGRGSNSTTTSSSYQSNALPKVEPIVVSYEGLGAYLVTTSGPLLRVHQLPDGKTVNTSRAHNGVIVSLVPVPAAVNRLQAMTCARCLTIVVWDVARVQSLARIHVSNLVDLQSLRSPSHLVPLGLSLSVGRKKDVPYVIGWLCMQSKNKDGNKVSSVRSFPLQLKDLLKLSNRKSNNNNAVDFALDNNDNSKPNQSGKSKSSSVLSKVAGLKLKSSFPNAFRSSYGGGLVAAADNQRVCLWKPGMKPEEGVALHHTKTLTSIAIYGGEDMLAVGDKVGQILIYKLNHEVLWSADKGERDASHLPSTFHWHSSSVLCLEWGVKDEGGLSPEIVHLYSGGSECTLVIWEFPQGKRNYLPRFPAPLLSLKGCHSMREELGMESFLAVGCADNSIVVVNVTTKTRVCTIAGLQVPYDRVVSLGRNPANGHAEVSLFKSNRGVLQKYNLDQDCQVSQLSVAYNQDQTPFVKARKGQKSSWAAGVGKSKEGTLLSYCADQQFLCTAEQYTNGMNIWLKFWSAKPNKKYEVEKTILNPHEQQITCILGHKQRSLVVTCSRDGKFKLWTREDNEWVCSCEASVPCLHVSTCCFSGKGDVFVASFGDNVGFWDIDNLSLMTVLKCPPSLGVKKFQSLSLMSEDKPAFMVGVWVSKDKKSKGITVWNLLNLKHLWSYRVQGGDCHVCCTSRSLSSSCKFAVSVTSEACKEDGTHSTKVLFFSPKSSEPEKVWHVSAYASDLFSIGNQVVIATREGNFISQDFATKVKDVVSQVTKDKSKLSKQYTLTSAPANGKDTTEKDSSAMDLDAVEFDSSSEFQGGLPKILSKYQNVPSHVLPPMSKLFEGLLQ